MLAIALASRRQSKNKFRAIEKQQVITLARARSELPG
jgi:hypothetical protein